MTERLHDIPSSLAEAPFSVPDRVERLGEALWLYSWLALHVNGTGRVCRTSATIERALGVPKDRIDEWLGRLVDARLVHVLHPVPYLVIKLRFWSGSRPDASVSGSAPTRACARVDELLPEQQPKAAPAAGEVGGAGEGEGIVAEAVQTLGAAAHQPEIRRLVAEHPVEHVRQALQKAARTPLAQIRKSRLALFRHLLVRLASQSR